MVGMGMSCVVSQSMVQVQTRTNSGWAALIQDFLRTPFDDVPEAAVVSPEVKGTGPASHTPWAAYAVTLNEADRELLRRVQAQPAALWVDGDGTLHEAVTEVYGPDDGTKKTGFRWLLGVRSQIMTKLGTFVMARQGPFFGDPAAELVPVSVRAFARRAETCPSFAYAAIRSSQIIVLGRHFPLKMFFCKSKMVHPLTLRRWVWNYLAWAGDPMTGAELAKAWNRNYPSDPAKRMKVRDFQRMASLYGIAIENITFLPVLP